MKLLVTLSAGESIPHIIENLKEICKVYTCDAVIESANGIKYEFKYILPKVEVKETRIG